MNRVNSLWRASSWPILSSSVTSCGGTIGGATLQALVVHLAHYHAISSLLWCLVCPCAGVGVVGVWCAHVQVWGVLVFGVLMCRCGGCWCLVCPCAGVGFAGVWCAHVQVWGLLVFGVPMCRCGGCWCLVCSCAGVGVAGVWCAHVQVQGLLVFGVPMYRCGGCESGCSDSGCGNSGHGKSGVNERAW